MQVSKCAKQALRTFCTFLTVLLTTLCLVSSATLSDNPVQKASAASPLRQQLATTSINNNNSTLGNATLAKLFREGGKRNSSKAMVAHSILTFTSVFFIACSVVIAIYSWRKYSESSYRVPLPYQYSALSQFDEGDPHDDDDDDDLDEFDSALEKDKLKASNGALVFPHDDKETSSDDDVFPPEQDKKDKPAQLFVTSEFHSETTKPARVSASSLLDGSSDEEIILQRPMPPKNVNESNIIKGKT